MQGKGYHRSYYYYDQSMGAGSDDNHEPRQRHYHSYRRVDLRPNDSSGKGCHNSTSNERRMMHHGGGGRNSWASYHASSQSGKGKFHGKGGKCQDHRRWQQPKGSGHGSHHGVHWHHGKQRRRRRRLPVNNGDGVGSTTMMQHLSPRSEAETCIAITTTPKDEQALSNLGGFPFRRLFAPTAEAQYLTLRSSELVEVVDMPDGNGKKLTPVAGAWDLCDGLSDLFNEHIRVRSRPLAAATPLERWGSLTDESLRDLAGQVAQDPPSNVTNVDLWRYREALCLSGPECSQFRPSIAKAFYTLCAGSLDMTNMQVLDPCGGWGDRLLGALASGVVSTITVVDPNPLLHPGYTAMALLEPAVSVKAICAPFEFADVEPELFDVVFTSPPFYDKERYWAPGSAGQAESLPGPRDPATWQKHWLEQWYVPFLSKAASCVRPGGIIGLYVCDTTSGGLCDATRTHLTAAGFSECVKLRTGRRRLLPILCFRRPEV